MSIAERREALKSALTDAAEKRIAATGLASLRARDLAREVGCALGAIYNVFPDLDALILAVNSRTLDMLRTHLAVIERGNVAAGRRGRAASVSDPLRSATARLVALAIGYMEFADRHRLRWRALFDHRMVSGQEVPQWHVEAQMQLFAFVEAPLAHLRPDLEREQRMLLARSLFSAVHGIVTLGLEEKLIAVPTASLRQQLAIIVGATVRGLGHEEAADARATAAPQ